MLIVLSVYHEMVHHKVKYYQRNYPKVLHHLCNTLHHKRPDLSARGAWKLHHDNTYIFLFLYLNFLGQIQHLCDKSYSLLSQYNFMWFLYFPELKISWKGPILVENTSAEYTAVRLLATDALWGRKFSNMHEDTIHILCFSIYSCRKHSDQIFYEQNLNYTPLLNTYIK